MTRTTGEVYDDNGTLRLRNVEEGWIWDFTPLQLQFVKPVAGETLAWVLDDRTKRGADSFI